MNERIEQILKQATEDIMGVNVVNQHKFAELIIRESARVSRRYADDGVYSDHYDDCGLDCLPGDMEQHTLEHFGLK